MNQLRKLLKQAGISPEQLSEAVGMKVRALSYHFSTGKIPYALIYKIHVVTGLEMDQVVPKHLAEEWLFMYDKQLKSNLPRGGKEQFWSKNLELNEPVHNQKPEDKLIVPRESSDIPKSVSIPVPETIVSPKISKTTKVKTSIADLMKSAPPAREPDEPDFSNVPDEIFSTSMDQIPTRKKR